MTTEENATAAADVKDAAAPEKDEAKIVEAVVERLRFFFSDANIRQDTFLRKMLVSDEHTVPIDVLLRFNTIKQHTEDPELVKKAVKDESLKDRILLTEDTASIKRVDPFTMDRMDDNIALTLVVDNLPTKTQEDGKVFYDVKTEEIRELFAQYGEVALVKLRFGPRTSGGEADDGDDLQSPSKNNSRKMSGPRMPRGSALVEFEAEKDCQAAADETLTKKEGEDVTPKRKLTIGEKDLSVGTLKDFIASVKKRKSNEEGADKKKEEGKKEEDSKPAKLFTMEWKPGCVLKLNGLKDSCDREALLDAIGQGLEKTLGEVKAMQIYVDFSRGQSHGAIRFHEPDESVKKLLDKLQSGEIKVAEEKVESVIILEGDEEKKYWDDFIEFKNKQLKHRQEERANRKQNNRRHGKRQRRN